MFLQAKEIGDRREDEERLSLYNSPFYLSLSDKIIVYKNYSL